MGTSCETCEPCDPVVSSRGLVALFSEAGEGEGEVTMASLVALVPDCRAISQGGRRGWAEKGIGPVRATEFPGCMGVESRNEDRLQSSPLAHLKKPVLLGYSPGFLLC